MPIGRDQVLKAETFEYRDIDVPEWGGSVRVREMKAADRDDWETSVYKLDTPDGKVKLDRKDFRAKLLVKCLVDENGDRLFADDEVAILSAKSAKVLIRLFAVAQEINGMSVEAEADISKK